MDSVTFTCFGFLGIVMQCQLPDIPVRTVTVCPVVERWTAEEQRRAAEELRTLGEGSAAVAAVGQLLRLRDQASACRKK